MRMFRSAHHRSFPPMVWAFPWKASTGCMSVAAGAYGTVVALGAALVSSRVYARHVELAADGTIVRTATTAFASRKTRAT